VLKEIHMNTGKTSCQDSVIFINNIHDGLSGNTERPSTEGDKSVVDFTFGGVMGEDNYVAEVIGRKEENKLLVGIAVLIALIVGIIISCAGCSPAYAEVTEASWYSVDSCKQEGTWQKWGGKYADGSSARDLDTEMVCAHRYYKFGTILRVTRIMPDGRDGRMVEVVVKDRGPSKKLYNRGRHLDLGRGAFLKLASLEKGVITVRIEEVI
jgi:hypothetical protein